MSDELTTIDTGDTTWMLVSIAIVMMMTPGLAFFEAGLLRRKNSLTIMMQCWAGLCWLSCLWYMFGFTLSLGPDKGGVIGGLDHAFFIDVKHDVALPAAPTIPGVTFATFQMMFAVISPLLCTGAFSGRLTWPAFLWFITLWSIIIYYPLCHWVWGGGFLAEEGVLDFAGGIVIHNSAGVTSLVMAIMLGPRGDFNSERLTPHNIPLAVIGGALLWMGWFGFNGGSALASGSGAANTVLCTHIAACTSGMVWMILSQIMHGKPSLVEAVNGAVAGLAGITPASGFVHSQSAFVLGIVLGLVSYYSVLLVKGRFKIDDALDVSSVHGVTGIVGSLAVGVCASTDVNSGGADGLLFGDGGTQLGKQFLGVVVASAWSAVGTFAIVRFIGSVTRLRGSPQQESTGFDKAELEEDAYRFHEDGHGDRGGAGDVVRRIGVDGDKKVRIDIKPSSASSVAPMDMRD